MKSKVVAILETRTGEHLGELIARRGGVPLLAPALEEVPDVAPGLIVGLQLRFGVSVVKPAQEGGPMMDIARLP